MKTAGFLAELAAAGAAPRLMVRYPNWVGDACMALPALEAVKKSLPGGRVEVVAKPWVADIVEMSPWADRVVRYLDPGEHAGLVRGRLRLAARLRREAYDGALLFQNAFEAAFIAVAAGIRRRGGYASEWRRTLLTHPVPPTPGNWPTGHLVDYYLDLVRALGFAAEVDGVPRLAPPPGTERDKAAVVFAPGASFGPAKMWPPDRYAALGREMVDLGFRVSVIGSGPESDVCARVAAGIGPAAVDLSGSTTLKEAAAVIASAALLVCNDSGLMHLGAALGTPLVAIFGSTDPGATGPVSARAAVVRGEAPCAPCFKRRCPRKPGMECFDGVTPAVVLEAARKVLVKA